ncbi:hypothetical protein, partial [Thiobacillus sp.]
NVVQATPSACLKYRVDGWFLAYGHEIYRECVIMTYLVTTLSRVAGCNPWVVYAFGEFEVAEKMGYAWRYYTDQNGLVKELRSPAAVAECVAADLALGAKYDRLMKDGQRSD